MGPILSSLPRGKLTCGSKTRKGFNGDRRLRTGSTVQIKVPTHLNLVQSINPVLPKSMRMPIAVSRPVEMSNTVAQCHKTMVKIVYTYHLFSSFVNLVHQREAKESPQTFLCSQ